MPDPSSNKIAPEALAELVTTQRDVSLQQAEAAEANARVQMKQAEFQTAAIKAIIAAGIHPEQRALCLNCGTVRPQTVELCACEGK